MTENRPRIFATLMGDIERQPGARVKYGLFFEAIGRKFPIVEIYDASLKGFRRYLNGMRVISRNRHIWKERFYKNVPAFRSRSQNAVNRIALRESEIDLILQVGVMFDAYSSHLPVPNVIYTDYTAALSARKLDSGRSPFTPSERRKWIALERNAFESATHICTRSAFVRNSILQEYGIGADKVTVVGGGVNIPVLPEPVLRLENQIPTVLFIGKDFYRKGGDVLLKAFAAAHEQVPVSRLFLVTADPIPPNLPQEGVAIIAPTWDRKAIANLYWRSDIFVLPSRLETWGDVLLEAMAFGLPCIGVAGEAMEEIIENEKTGIIVPPGEADALTAALVRLLQDSALRREIGQAARREMETEYSWDRVVERMEPVIGKVATAGAARNSEQPLRLDYGV